MIAQGSNVLTEFEGKTHDAFLEVSHVLIDRGSVTLVLHDPRRRHKGYLRRQMSPEESARRDFDGWGN